MKQWLLPSHCLTLPYDVTGTSLCNNRPPIETATNKRDCAIVLMSLVPFDRAYGSSSLWELQSVPMGARMACGLSGTGKLRKSTEYSVFVFSSMTSRLTFCSKKFESLSMLEFFFFLFVKQHLSRPEWSSLSYPRLIPFNKTKMYVAFMVPLLRIQNSK